MRPRSRGTGLEIDRNLALLDLPGVFAFQSCCHSFRHFFPLDALILVFRNGRGPDRVERLEDLRGLVQTRLGLRQRFLLLSSFSLA